MSLVRISQKTYMWCSSFG